jgi:predicted MFS family arabinose efflux permease
MNVPKRILPVIILSQFAGTSLWFAGNAIINDLQSAMNVDINDVGIVTSAIQLGFISGTLIFAYFALSDRYSPRKIYLVCSILGAVSNLLILFIAYDLFSLLVLRFITGFLLTGIYPIGMKIASGWYNKDLGNAIGLLVGALVLGTALPHLIKGIGDSLPWEQVIYMVSAISVIGGVSMYIFVPDGPNITAGTKFNPKAIISLFKIRNFRSAAFGYFGHMWELYTLWAFVPIILIYYNNENAAELNIFICTFAVIAAGSIGCIVGGWISNKVGSAQVAFTQLLLSGICCLVCPIFFGASSFILISFLIFWGIVVAGDSPQYSAIIALSAPKELVGSALTIVNSIGFAITILSLWVIFQISEFVVVPYYLIFLAPGPLFGLVSMRSLITNDKFLKESNN